MAGRSGMLQKVLLQWYDQNQRDLPWRRHPTPYKVWISEMMLQQTQVETVLPYFQRFLKQYPNLPALASAKEDELLKVWEGLGYYRRARHLWTAAKILEHQEHGRFPRSAQQWINLPGIGLYTARAIASIAFQEPVAVLDGNVKRVLARLTCFKEAINQASQEGALWSLAQACLDRKRPGDYNQAMMELGAMICREKIPACSTCPVRAYCRAFKTGRVAEFPRRLKRKKSPHHVVVVALLANSRGQWLIGKRPANRMLGGLWEFPGGKVNAKETLEEALVREIDEELGITVVPGREAAVVKHAYTHFKITLHAFYCRMPRGQQLQPLYHQQLLWINSGQFKDYPFPGANKKILALLEKQGRLSG